jgi:hypothetical protein
MGWSGKRKAKEAGTQAELKAGDRFFALLNTLLMRFSGYSLWQSSLKSVYIPDVS